MAAIGRFAKGDDIFYAKVVDGEIFRARGDILSTGWWNAFVQGRFTLENYMRVLSPSGSSDSLGRNFINSIIITVPSTVLPVFFASLAAYAFAWTRFRGRDWIFMVIVGLLVVPLQMTFVPVLQLYNDPLSPIRALGGLIGLQVDVPKLQVTSTFVGLWLAHTAYGLPFAIYLLRSFFAALPVDLFDAAKMDGGSEFRIFFWIVVPLSVPALAAITIVQGLDEPRGKLQNLPAYGRPELFFEDYVARRRDRDHHYDAPDPHPLQGLPGAEYTLRVAVGDFHGAHELALPDDFLTDDFHRNGQN